MIENAGFDYVAKMIYLKPSQERLKEFIDKNPWVNEPLTFGEEPPKQEVENENKI